MLFIRYFVFLLVNMLLKKKINIILFNMQLNKSFFILIVPNFCKKKSDNKTFRGTSYTFFKTKGISLAIPNMTCLYFTSKLEFLKYALLFYKDKFFGFKYNNFFFEAANMCKYNYLMLINLNDFLGKLRKIYFYFLRFVYFFRSKYDV